MTKRFCDRCGAEIKESFARISIGEPPLTFIAPEYDLCKNCAKEVKEWLLERRKNDD